MKDFKLLLFSIILLITYTSCEKKVGGFLVDDDNLALYEVLVEKSEFTSFVKIIDAANLSSALNSHGNYTLFCPTNDAVNEYIQQSNYSSLDELIADQDFVNVLARYHLVMSKYLISDLSYGTIGDSTATGDYLSISFGQENDEYAVIVNNLATVVEKDLEVNNGIIHALNQVLKPVIYDSFELLQEFGNYTIFCEALLKTGLRDTMTEMTINALNEPIENRYTLLAETDDLYAANGINNYNDLEARFSTSSDPKDKNNQLYQYMAFHILPDKLSLVDFETTNYQTFGDELLAVKVDETIWLNYWTNWEKDTIDNGDGNIQIIDVQVNYGQEPDYLTSNMVSSNGSVHTLTQLLIPHTPKIVAVKFFPGDLSGFADSRNNFSMEYFNPDAFEQLDWSDTDGGSIWYRYQTGASGVTGGDFIEMSGLFSMEYITDKILAGEYEVNIRINTVNSGNATIQCFLDGSKAGGLLDLRDGLGSGKNMFRSVSLGTFNFPKTSGHYFKVEAFIPGTFAWNFIEFIPAD